MNQTRSPQHAVVLIDEIDKADPDVPNNLLVPLGSLEFRVEETNSIVQSRMKPDQYEGTPTGSSATPLQQPAMSNLLIIITTNEERELPLAFLRRCVVYELKPPKPERLVEIAKLHLQSQGRRLGERDAELLLRLAKKLDELRGVADTRGNIPPSTAEYLDAVRACLTLEIDSAAESDKRQRAWKLLESVVFQKQRELLEDRP